MLIPAQPNNADAGADHFKRTFCIKPSMIQRQIVSSRCKAKLIEPANPEEAPLQVGDEQD